MEEKYGYTPDEIEQISRKVLEVSNSLCNYMVDCLQKNFVGKMAVSWCASEAITYFTKVNINISNYNKKIENVFNNYLELVKKVTNKWSNNVSGEDARIINVSGINLNLDISSIKDNLNGKVFIIPNALTEMNLLLNTCKNEMEENAKLVSSNFVSETAFMGANQTELASKCFEKVLFHINEFFKEITDELSREISEYNEKYSIQATKVFKEK